MAKHLVIVESPAKQRTISKYLGRNYLVKASVGHVRDLPRKDLGVDIENGFRPTYVIVPGKEKIIQEIAQAAAQCEMIYLATDPDREGEAIAWHVSEAANLDAAKLRRITFYQVTKRAVQEALSQPRGLDWNLIQAQQARRVLDRLVGYQISPLLSRAIRKGWATRKPLSAGRVQSVALRLVVEREREIMAFVPEEYWTLEAELQRRTEAKERFRAHLHRIAGAKPKISSREEMDALLPLLSKATFVVTEVKKGQRTRRPSPPFITSTLQAEAGRKLHFSARQTMRLAQQLYEGIDLDGERVGLITYMRTDSTNVAPEAQAEARRYIAQEWGEDFLPSRPPRYRSRAALAQEAHEAIRPTSVFRTPESVRPHLTAQQARLYELIWRRFLASQMKPALYATMRVDILAGDDYLFRATGQSLLFKGFLVVYSPDMEEDQEAPVMLPELQEGEALDLLQLIPEQHFTQPPPRYSEPTLIRELEANGVGRPSTYATIVSIIQERGYVVKQQRQLVPTALGMLVCDVLVDTFADIMDVGYTASMEERLDKIAAGQLEYLAMLREFYEGFRRELEAAKARLQEAVKQALWAGLPEDLKQRTCPKCGRPLELRISEKGRFLGCTGYPECNYILDLSDPHNPKEPEEEDEFAEGEFCELCGGRMKIIRRGRMVFLGCENYPKCKNTRPFLSERIKKLAAETACPQCGYKPLEPRSGRYGEYLRCPKCQVNFSLAKLGLGGKKKATVETVDIACPECGHRPMEKRVGRYGPYYRCPACKKNFSEKKMAAFLGGIEALKEQES